MDAELRRAVRCISRAGIAEIRWAIDELKQEWQASCAHVWLFKPWGRVQKCTHCAALRTSAGASAEVKAKIDACAHARRDHAHPWACLDCGSIDGR